MPGLHSHSTCGGAFREREDEEVEWKPSCVVHLTRPEGGDLAAMRACFNLKDTLKTTFFVGSADGELVYADWIKPEVSLLWTVHLPLSSRVTMQMLSCKCSHAVVLHFTIKHSNASISCLLNVGSAVVSKQAALHSAALGTLL